MIKRIKRFLCKYLGHCIDPIDAVIFLLKATAVNTACLSPELKCSRCGKTLIGGVYAIYRSFLKFDTTSSIPDSDVVHPRERWSQAIEP